ncbi:MAG TPA: hypothetical protein VLH36_13555 [Steroidobacteraceae bacterium]|nr:hypothetical protein [Steroidobacteraceae bacterium]
MLKTRDTVELPRLQSTQGRIDVVTISSVSRMNLEGRQRHWAGLIRPLELSTATIGCDALRLDDPAERRRSWGSPPVEPQRRPMRAAR